jgi:hypothetical protein
LGAKRIATELIAGYGGGVVVGYAGFLTGALLGYALNLGEDAIEKSTWIGGFMGVALGSTVGVHYIGNRGNETGSFKVTLAGSVSGLGVVGIPMLIIGVEFEKQKPIPPQYGIIVGAAPAVGATIGFNLTRRYELSAISNSQTNQAAPAFRLDLLRVRF